MVFKPKILAFAGSLREASYNKKLVAIAVEGAKSAGAEVELIDLRDFPMPILDQDDEDEYGLPENAIALKQLMLESHGFLISSPEYNSSLSAALKNAIDWASRKETSEEEALVCFKGKVAALMSASPGGLGGLRGLVHLRAILQNIHVMVIPTQKCISSAFEAFDPSGNLLNEKDQKAVTALGAELVEVIGRLNS